MRRLRRRGRAIPERALLSFRLRGEVKLLGTQTADIDMHVDQVPSAADDVREIGLGHYSHLNGVNAIIGSATDAAAVAIRS